MAFGRLPSRPADAPMSEINVTPLVDVMLVLLVIFILTAPLMTSAIRLDLPQSEGGESGAAPQAVVLVVDAQGGWFLNDQPIAENALRAQLAQAARRNPLTELEFACRCVRALWPGGRGHGPGSKSRFEPDRLCRRGGFALKLPLGQRLWPC